MQLVTARIRWIFPGDPTLYQKEISFPQLSNQSKEYVVSICFDAMLKALSELHKIAEEK